MKISIGIGSVFVGTDGVPYQIDMLYDDLGVVLKRLDRPEYLSCNIAGLKKLLGFDVLNDELNVFGGC